MQKKKVGMILFLAKFRWPCFLRKLFNSLPNSFKNQVKLLSGNTRRNSQIILVMKDGNVVIGNTATLNSKLKYYDTIRIKAGKHSLIDLEIGAFSRPLTSSEKKAYGIS